MNPASMAGISPRDVAVHAISGSAHARHTRGDAAKADAALQEYLRRKNGDEYAYPVAQIHAWRGEADETFAWLDRAWEHRELEATDILSDAVMLRYKHDPRFAAYCLKVGLPLPGKESSEAPASGESS